MNEKTNSDPGFFKGLVNRAQKLFEPAPDPSQAYAFYNKIVEQGSIAADKLDPAPLSDVSLNILKEKGNLIELKQSDVTSAFAGIARAKPDGTFDIPVYVVAGLGKGATDIPEARLLKTTDGYPFVLVNEGYHKWNEDYVRDHIMMKDERLDDPRVKVHLERPEDFLSNMAYIADMKQRTPGMKIDSPDAGVVARAQQRYQSLLDYVYDTAEGMGVKNPRILIDSTGNEKNGGVFSGDVAAAATTAGDKNYVFIHKSTLLAALYADSDKGMDLIRADVGHEIAHIGNGDTRPAGMMAARSGATMRYEEAMADLRGMGPLGTRNPETLANYFEGELRELVPAYLRDHKGSKMSPDSPSDDDLKKVSQWIQDQYPEPSHPSYWDRVASLRDEAVLMKDYERGHPPQGQRERVAEAQFVEAQVLKDMSGKRQLSIENAAGRQTEPPVELSDAQKAEIANIRTAMVKASGETDMAGIPAVKSEQRSR